MWEYGHLKFVLDVEKEDGNWFFSDGNKDFEEVDSSGKNMLTVLNFLGSKKWELASIDPQIGYIFKRLKEDAK